MPQKLFLALFLTGCTGSALDSGGGSYADADSQSTGFIFKGPMSAGSTITVQPLDDGLSPTGDAVEVSVEDDSGAFTAALPFQGPVLVTAVGTTFDEAYGEVVEAPLTLSAYAYIDGDEVGGRAGDTEFGAGIDGEQGRLHSAGSTGWRERGERSSIERRKASDNGPRPVRWGERVLPTRPWSWVYWTTCSRITRPPRDR